MKTGRLEVPPKKEDARKPENNETGLQENEILDLSYSFVDSDSKYREKYFDLPKEVRLDIFSDKSIKFLNNYSTEERLYLIARAINNNLLNSPNKSENYFKSFPDDKKIILKILDIQLKPPRSHYYIQKAEDISILALAASLKHGKNSPKEESCDEKEYGSWLTGDRMNRAQDLVIGDGDMDPGYLSTYGRIGEKLINKLNEAEKLNFYDIEKMSTKDLFNKNFSDLSKKDKKNLLIKYLGTLHNILLYEEVWNSRFSEKFIRKHDEMNKKLLFGRHDISQHSMIFHSFHSNSIYRDMDREFFDFQIDSPFDTGQGVEEYAFHKLAIATLEEIKKIEEDKEEVINFVLDFWNKNRNPIFGEYVAEIFSNLDPNYASTRLLDMIYKEKVDKNHLSSILYRLEFGKIGISDDGVRYLEKMYDLGEYNNKNYSVERLTPRGEIGIFNEEEKLIKYFELGDITQKKDSIVKAKVLDFVYETLFLPKQGESEEEKKQRLLYLNEFTEKYHKLSQNKIFSETGIYLNNLTLKEQGSFIFYLNSLDEASNKERLVNFINNYREFGLRTFLSIQEGGKEMGDKILTLGEKLPEGVAQKVFQKYGQIIDNVDRITDFAKNNFSKEVKTNPDSIQKTEEALYSKGKQILSQVYNDIKNKKEINLGDVSRQLDRINADTITTFAIFKQAVKSGERLPLESIEGSMFSKKRAGDFSVEEKEEMSELYDKNYRHHQDKELITEIKKYFNSAFAPESNKSKNYFYTFEKDNKIRAFVRFEEIEKNNLYASALNVDEASKNFGLGESMMDQALRKEAENNTLRASCLIDSPSNMRYFEKGFISSGFIETSKTRQFNLIWNELKNKNILSKQITQEELIEMFPGDAKKNIEIKKSKELNNLHSNIPLGKSLVRCFLDKNSNEWFAVYEKTEEGYEVYEPKTPDVE